MLVHSNNAKYWQGLLSLIFLAVLLAGSVTAFAKKDARLQKTAETLAPIRPAETDTLYAVPHGVPENLYKFFHDYYNIELTADDNLELFGFVKRWHRTPYVYAGTSRYGLDCSGFTYVLNDSIYARRLPRCGIQQSHVCEPIKKKHDLRTGDLVFFKARSRYITHVGVYLKDNKFAHSASIFGVIVSDLDEPYYKRFYSSGGRINEDLVPILRSREPIIAAVVEPPCYDPAVVREFLQAQRPDTLLDCDGLPPPPSLYAIHTVDILRESRMTMVRSNYRTLSFVAGALNYARLKESLVKQQQLLIANPKAHRLAWSPTVNKAICFWQKVASFVGNDERYVYSFKATKAQKYAQTHPKAKTVFSANAGKNRPNGI